MKAKIFILLLSSFCIYSFTYSQQPKPKRSKHQIAKDLKNPLSTHYLIQFENDFETGDVDDQFQYDLELQSVVPFVFGDRWKIITRTTVPVLVNQFNGIKGNGPSGVGDINLLGLLAPQKKVKDITWGFGLSMDMPTASESGLGNQKWTIGPSALFLKENKNWTVGFLLSQAWSYAGKGSQNVSYLSVDSWLGYTWKSGFGITIECESFFDWVNDEQTIPIRFGIDQVFMIGKQSFSIDVDGLYYPVRPIYEAKWGGSLTITLVFDHTRYR